MNKKNSTDIPYILPCKCGEPVPALENDFLSDLYEVVCSSCALHGPSSTDMSQAVKFWNDDYGNKHVLE